MSNPDFEIDPEALDKECIQHPSLVHKYHTALAEAKAGLEITKTKLEEKKSNLEKRIRDNPAKYDITKLTEGAVAAYIKGNEVIQKLSFEVKNAQMTLDLAWADVHAITAKQQSLSDLVRLHGQQYFDTPTVTPEGVAEINKNTRKKGIKKREE